MSVVDRILEILYFWGMSPTELFFERLKRMQETAKKIKPAPKEVVDKIVLPSGISPSKKGNNCLF